MPEPTAMQTPVQRKLVDVPQEDTPAIAVWRPGTSATAAQNAAFRANFLTVAGWPLFAICVALSLFAIGSTIGLPIAGLAPIVFLVLVAAFPVFLRRIPRLQFLPGPEDEWVGAEAADEDEWYVEMSVLQDGYVTGSDRGILIIEKDTLAFTGNRTSFCIGRQDLRSWRAPVTVNVRAPELVEKGRVVWLAHPNREVAVAFVPIHRKNEERYLRLTLAVDLFTRSDEPSSEPRSYPPLVADPLYRPSSALILGLVFSTPFVFLMALLFEEPTAAYLLATGVTILLGVALRARAKHVALLRSLRGRE
jgi:hypothetical protein